MHREYFELFVNKSKNYYLEFFDNYEKDKKIHFNFMAFLFGLFWFLYRKMNIEAFVLFIILLLETTLEKFITAHFELTNTDTTIGIQLVSSLTFAIFLGLFGNWIYIKHANRKILSITRIYQHDEQILKEKIQRKGGTSFIVIGTIIALIISTIVISKT
jgi:hypothetical protein